MKTKINEIKRLQKLAGLLKENNNGEFESSKNSYSVRDEESNDYYIDKNKAIEYLSQFNNEEINAEVFVNDDKAWSTFEETLNNTTDPLFSVEKISDEELEKLMKQEMSYYFFSKPDEIK
jgi:tRNA G18 (ribose-2'-O)-methylase SpoU